MVTYRYPPKLNIFSLFCQAKSPSRGGFFAKKCPEEYNYYISLKAFIHYPLDHEYHQTHQFVFHQEADCFRRPIFGCHNARYPPVRSSKQDGSQSAAMRFPQPGFPKPES
jgi:hypothetical protein